jgi:hypothetical protein
LVRPLNRPGSTATVVPASTAVLFSTGGGLHLRTLDPRWGDEEADDVSTSVVEGERGRPGGPSSSSFPPAGPWGEDSQPRYVFQFCDLAIIEDLPKHSPDASTALAVMVSTIGQRKVQYTSPTLQEKGKPCRFGTDSLT